MREVLEFIGTQPFANRFYLAGGTALALQLGHRISIDLDFFSETDELEQASRQEIVTAFGQQFPLEVDEGGLASLILP
jgi:predicted nucleotidyltransferase component of viral defense system